MRFCQNIFVENSFKSGQEVVLNFSGGWDPGGTPCINVIFAHKINKPSKYVNMTIGKFSIFDPKRGHFVASLALKSSPMRSKQGICKK